MTESEKNKMVNPLFYHLLVQGSFYIVHSFTWFCGISFLWLRNHLLIWPKTYSSEKKSSSWDKRKRLWWFLRAWKARGWADLAGLQHRQSLCASWCPGSSDRRRGKTLKYMFCHSFRETVLVWVSKDPLRHMERRICWLRSIIPSYLTPLFYE